MTHIYFIQQCAERNIKIGFSSDYKKRMERVQSLIGSKVIVLAVMPGGRAEEMQLHKRFKDSRIFGEWFLPTDELMELINSLPPVNYQNHNPKGEGHNCWKGSDASLEAKRYRFRRIADLDKCAHCGKKAFDRRCIDGNYENVSCENILMLCRRCSMVHDGRLDQFAANRNQTPKQPPKPCSNCSMLFKPLRKGECRKCSEYRYRHGQSRPLI